MSPTFYHEKSSIGFHGNLKSENCIVDGRLTVKVTDFGIPTILESMRHGKLVDKMKAIKHYQLML